MNKIILLLSLVISSTVVEAANMREQFKTGDLVLYPRVCTEYGATCIYISRIKSIDGDRAELKYDSYALDVLVKYVHVDEYTDERSGTSFRMGQSVETEFGHHRFISDITSTGLVRLSIGKKRGKWIANRPEFRPVSRLRSVR